MLNGKQIIGSTYWQRCFCRICGVLISLFAIGLFCPRVAGDEWSGWRGLDNEGRSQYSEGPSRWSPDKNILWKIQIPGEGHSSPIVSQDAVYLTTTYMVKRDAFLKLAAKYAQLVGVLLLAVFAIHFVVRCCRNLRDNDDGLRPFVCLTGFALIVATLCAFVFFGEECFNFDRCSIRQWIATSVFVSMCLVMCAFYASSRSRLRLMLGISLLLFAGFVTVCVPAKGHAYRGGALSLNSSVMLAVAGMPGLMGMMLLSLYLLGLSRRREMNQDCETARSGSYLVPILKWFTIVCVGVVLVILARVVLNRQAGADLIDETYKPAVKWWVVSAFAGVFAMFLIIRLTAGNSFWANLGVVIGALPFCLISAVALSEQVIARSPYLSYHLGTPRLKPILGWQAVGVFAVVCLLCLIVSAIAERRRHGAGECKLPAGFQIAAIFLAVLYFASVNYLTKKLEYARAVVCIDRNSGVIRWTSEGLLGPRGQMDKRNSAATPTPVTDGTRVYAYFGTVGFFCTDLSGKVLWTCKELPYETVHGVAVSPVLCDDRIIVLSESRIGGHIAALDCKTGNLLWKTDRHKKINPSVGNCRTPLIKEIKGHEVIVVWGDEDVSGYDPLTGQRHWSHYVEGVGDPVASMVSDDKRLYLAGHRETLALAIDKLGTHENPVVWRRKILGPICSSPVIKNGLLFIVSDSGIAHCLDAESGNTLWRKRLKGKHYSSLVAIGGRIYFCNTRGLTTVVACDKTYQKIPENDLREQTYASFAVVDGKIFIRTKNHLYCVHEQ